MQPLTGVIKHLVIINVLAFIALQIMGEPAYNVNITDPSMLGKARFYLYYPASPFFEPFQIVTHMFLHGGVGHLFFNMFALYIFGPMLEYKLGEKRFLFLYFFAGFGSVLVHILSVYVDINFLGAPMSHINIPMVGASGAVSGIMIAFALKFPNHQIGLLFLPFRFKAAYLVMAFIAYDVISGFQSYDTGVAHFAHLGGIIFGLILIEIWDKFYPKA